MQKLNVIFFSLFFMVSCSDPKIETIEIGNKKSELLEIKFFNNKQIAKNIISKI